MSQNTRLVIDVFRDDPVLYDKKCKDYGNQVPTKKVFSPILVKFKNNLYRRDQRKIIKRIQNQSRAVRRHVGFITTSSQALIGLFHRSAPSSCPSCVLVRVLFGSVLQEQAALCVPAFNPRRPRSVGDAELGHFTLLFCRESQ